MLRRKLSRTVADRILSTLAADVDVEAGSCDLDFIEAASRGDWVGLEIGGDVIADGRPEEVEFRDGESVA